MNPRTFVAFLVGRVLSTLGRQMMSVAIGWELYDRTGSFVVLGLVGLAQVTPVILLAAPMGSAVDRFDARRTGALSCLLLSFTGAAFALLSYAPDVVTRWGIALDTSGDHARAPLWMIFTLLVIHGTGMAAHAPSLSSIVPRLVDKEARARANAVVATGFELASIGGPAVAGGILAATKSAAPVYAIQCASSLVLLVVLVAFYARGVAAPEASSSTTSGRSFADMIAGVRFVASSRLLLPAMSLDLFAVLFGGVTALLPAFAKDILHVGPDGLGMLRASPACGALVMALISTRLPPWKRPGRALFASIVGFGACTLAFSLSTWLPLSCALLAMAGAADEVSVIIRMTLEQMVVPDAVRGRVSAVRYVFIGMSNELGELESGLAAAALGAVPSVVAGSLVCLSVVAFVGWRFPELVKLGPLASLTPESNAPPLSSG